MSTIKRISFSKTAHYLAGFLTAIAPRCLGVLGFLVFATYEFTEYVKKHDTLYLEFREYGVGFFVGVLLRIIMGYVTLK